MVGVGELALIGHQTAGHTAVAVGVAALRGRRLVDVGEESFNGFLYGVGAAEGANQARLLQRVTGLAQLVAHHLTLTTGQGPLAHVKGVAVCGQHLVHAEGGAVLIFKHELSAFGGTGPVEEALQLIGGVVKQLNTYA